MSAVTRLVAAFDAHPDTIARADYVCDGVNDEAEINNASTDLPNPVDERVGGVVALSEGTFKVSTKSILIKRNNVSLMGAGPATTPYWTDQPLTIHRGRTTIVVQGLGDPVIDINPTGETTGRKDHITIEGLSIVARSRAQRVARIGIRAKRVSNLYVHRVYIRNLAHYGMGLYDLWDSRFRDGQVVYCGSQVSCRCTPPRFIVPQPRFKTWNLTGSPGSRRHDPSNLIGRHY